MSGEAGAQVARLGVVELVERFPGVEDYLRRRVDAGLAPRSEEAARRGLVNMAYVAPRKV